jgi:hypothetical protein
MASSTEATGDAVLELRDQLTPAERGRVRANVTRVRDQARVIEAFVIYAVARVKPQSCSGRSRRGRAPRQRVSVRRRGSRRSTSARGDPDDPDLDPEHPAVASCGRTA